MKTLLVYSELSGFAIQIKDHIYSALEDLQCEVRECYIDDVVRASEAFQPIMHLFLHHAHKLYEHRDAIAALKGHKLLWTMEDPYESDVTFDMLPLFYYVFTSDENTARALVKDNGGNKVFYVPHACNPKVHRPEPVPFEYRGDVLFVGNAYPSRLEFFRNNALQYTHELVTIVGVGYRGLDGYQHQRVIHGHISEPETVRYMNGHSLVLNLHRQNRDLDMANTRKIPASSFNNRYYEAWACGRQQLVVGRGDKFLFEGDYREAHRDHSYKARLAKYYIPLLEHP